MKARGGGAIVNCGSTAATTGGAGGVAYAAAKEAIRGLTKGAAVEWGRDNISVNVICPLATHDPERWNTHGNVVEGVPMRRLGTPEADVGALVVFLAGPGRFVTGRTLFVDGGSGTFR
jgi:NAD(P)-dependent dehydrogenase (short-subunit alcohol dehydrogenase family)